MARIPQDFVDQCLLSDDRDDKCLGRLLATEVWPAFEEWLDGEPAATGPQAVSVLNATISFAVLAILAAAQDGWPHSSRKREMHRVIHQMVAHRLQKLMEEN